MFIDMYCFLIPDLKIPDNLKKIIFYLDPVQGQGPRVVLDLIVEAEVVVKAEASPVLSLDLVPNLSPNQDPVPIHPLNLAQTAPRARSSLAAEAVAGA